MQIKDILKYRVTPFEIMDEKMKSIFSFYLHLAPTVESNVALPLPAKGLDATWIDFINMIAIEKDDFMIYAPGYINQEQLVRFSLENESIVTRKTKRFVCCRKVDELELACFLRHIRNYIAHGNVYVLEKKKKIYHF